MRVCIKSVIQDNNIGIKKKFQRCFDIEVFGSFVIDKSTYVYFVCPVKILPGYTGEKYVLNTENFAESQSGEVSDKNYLTKFKRRNGINERF